MTSRLAALGFLLLAACARTAEAPDSVPTPGPGAIVGDAIRGVVRIVGSAPVNVQVVLQPESGRAIRLVGPLRSELERLAGIEVSVRGAIAPSPDPIADRELNATSYDIVAVNGMPVVVGEVVEVDAGVARLRTAAGEVVVLASPPTGLRVGQKIWVQGPRSLVVQSFGVIRP
jgi:hypothetical protein